MLLIILPALLMSLSLLLLLLGKFLLMVPSFIKAFISLYSLLLNDDVELDIAVANIPPGIPSFWWTVFDTLSASRVPQVSPSRKTVVVDAVIKVVSSESTSRLMFCMLSIDITSPLSGELSLQFI